MLNSTKHLNSNLIDFLIESNLIEGYETDYNDYVTFLNEQTIYNLHVANSCRAMMFVVGQSFDPKRELTADDILTLHKTQMTDLDPPGKNCLPGNFRGDGHLVTIGGRHAPHPGIMVHLLHNWKLDFNDYNHTPIESHTKFEFIHPFLDGNGRVGRLLWVWDMNRRGLSFHRFLDQFEGENFEQKRKSYYNMLSKYAETR